MPIDLLPDLDYHSLGKELSIPGLDNLGDGQSTTEMGGGEVSGEEMDIQEELLQMIEDKKKKSGDSIKDIVQEYNENPINLVGEYESSCMLKVAADLLSKGRKQQGQSVQGLWIQSAIGSIIPQDVYKTTIPIEMSVQGNHLQCFEVSGICAITCNSKVVYATIEPMTLSSISQLFHNIVCGADEEQRG